MHVLWAPTLKLSIDRSVKTSSIKDRRAQTKTPCHNIVSHGPSQNDRKEWKILKTLRRNKNIVILKPDKGNGVDRITWGKSILNLITGSSKLNKINCDPTLSREGKLLNDFCGGLRRRMMQRTKTSALLALNLLKSILITEDAQFTRALRIGWENPPLNKQVNHVNLTFSF